MSLKKNENIEKNLNRFEISVDSDTFNMACDKVYEKDAKKIKIPGFRQGKAPKKVIEKFYGSEVFFEEAINMVSGRAIDEAVKESGLDVVAVRNFNVIRVDNEEGLYFSIDCTTRPDIEMKKYKGYEIEKPIRKVEEKEVNEQIMQLRKRVARIIKVEEDRPCKEGDMVNIDFTGYIDGVSFQGGAGKNYELELGSKQFIEGFEKNVEGHKVNEEFEFEVDFPKDYQAEDLKGKTALFKCKINAIKTIELPEEDDEFAKDVSQFNSLDELKKDIRSSMEKFNSDNSERYVENELLSKIVENVEGEIPQVMFENKYDELFDNFVKDIRRRGMRVEEYFQNSGVNEEDFRQNMQGQAVFQVKLDLALRKIIELENLTSSEEDIENEYKNLRDHYRVELEDVRRFFPVEAVKNEIVNRKAIDFVRENSKIVEKEVKA